MSIQKPKKVLLLFDSFHNNTGDKAIGEALKHYFEGNNYEVDFVDPFTDKLNSLREDVIIGGGDLIHDPGHPFYDSFRLKGRHILNAAGISSTKNLSYLSDYRYISVRSKGDKARLSRVIDPKRIHIVPCTSMLLSPKIVKQKNSKLIGFHFHHVSYQHVPDITQVLMEFPGYTKIAVPFTHYNDDLSVMRVLFRGTNTKFLKYSEVQQILNAIATFDFFICSSLHAAIFAYIANVPFLVHNYHPKVDSFMRDRGLENWLFTNEDELLVKVRQLKKASLNYTALLDADRKAIHRHLASVEKLIQYKNTSTDGYTNPGPKKIAKYSLFLLTREKQLDFKLSQEILHKQSTINALTVANSIKQQAIEHLQLEGVKKQQAIEELRKNLSALTRSKSQNSKKIR